MKKIFILLAALLVLNGADAQSCLPEGITFSTQAQINNFRTDYPGCTQIDGNVLISGYNIINLNGLSVLTSIGGSLLIECNEALTSLAGLDNVTFIGGNLYSEGNILLTSLSGLHHVTFIGGDIEFTNNTALTNLTGLEGLTSIGGKLWIDYNNALTSLTGLNHVSSVTGIVRIYSNDALLSLTGLEGLTFIGGSLIIGGQEHLGGLGNPSLTSLMALSNVTSIGGNLDIGYNTALTSLTGLDNIDAGSIVGLSVYNNGLLSVCEVESICDYLTSPNGIVNISNNATGCNSQAEVEEACIVISLDKTRVMNAVSVYPNPTSDYITIETPATLKKAHLTIVNPRGQELIRYEITGPTSQINLTGLPCGVYFVRIDDEQTFLTQKIMKH